MSIIPLATIKQDVRKGQDDVFPYLKRDLKLLSFTQHALLQDTIIKCFEERALVGVEKYKTPLQTKNGRDPLVDAFQEALDLVMYLTQQSIENGYNDYSLQNKAIEVLMVIATKLEAKYGTDRP